jgi:hypothetical protein
MSMPLASLDQHIQLIGWKCEYRTVEALCKISRTRPVFRVIIIISATGIMQEGKELDDCSIGSCRSRQ